MFSTAKRLFKFNGYNVGIASVVDSHGSSFLQVALLLGNEKPVATMSRLIPKGTTTETEIYIKNMTQGDISPLITILKEEMPTFKMLTNALNTAKENSTRNQQPQVELKQRKSYKKTIR